MAKAPAFQFYTGDWLKDPALQACSSSTRGIWINLIACMWESKPRGTVSGSIKELMRISNSNSIHMKQFLNENSRHGFADIESNNGVVRISCRRMVREENEREKSRARVAKHRSSTDDVTDLKRECNENVTPPSSSSSSSSVTKVTYTPDFESFWTCYPNDRRKEKANAFSCWKARLKEGVNSADLIRAVKAYIAECDKNGTEPQFIKLPATFLSKTKRPFDDYVELAKRQAEETRLAHEKAKRRERTISERHEQEELKPDPEQAKRLKAMARTLAEGKAIQREA